MTLPRKWVLWCAMLSVVGALLAGCHAASDAQAPAATEETPAVDPTPAATPVEAVADLPPPRPVSLVYGYFPVDQPEDAWQLELVDHLEKNIRWNLKRRRPDLTGMVRIPAGAAMVGSDFVARSDSERLPARHVEVATFHIDRTEVTNRAYNQCVAARQCLPVPQLEHIPAYDDPDRPALLTYRQAERYCLWTGKRLPTEIEWEKAARGADGRTYPWGDQPPDPTHANICGDQCVMDWAAKSWHDGFAFTAPVESFPAGDSPYGVRNMSGNVKEWVTTLEDLPENQFIARGASWYSDRIELLATYRQTWLLGIRLDDKGVRCAANGR